MTMSIEEFKEIYKTSTQKLDTSEEQAEDTTQKEIDYPNSTYDGCFKNRLSDRRTQGSF